MYQFDCPQPVALSVRLASGSAEIIAEDRSDATVDVQPFDGSDASRKAADNTRVELRDGMLVVEAPDWTGMLFRRGPRLRVTVHLPQDGDLALMVASADVRATGRFGSANLTTASGDVSVDHLTGDVSLKSASGDMQISRVDGGLRINGASGDFVLGQVGGDLSAKLASGDLSVDRIGGPAKATTASGDVTVGTAVAGLVQINTASGDVSVGVTPGTAVWLDLSSLSGDTNTDLAMPDSGGTESAATLTVKVRTASGDIDVHRSYAGASA
jgi:DUF4097 and DUF4098 domain-containing protein YvlB